jgi:hypothetical protein
MSPLMVSAHFAAYIWFTAQPENSAKAPAEAMQFAHEKWPRFLKLAHPGLGRLLLKMAEVPTARRRQRRERTLAALTAAPRKRTAPYDTAGEQPFSCN